jgi:phage terminase Nu1 subunit (DNA packaging protein)
MAEKLHGNAGEVWCSGREIRRIFGIADKTLADRGVRTRKSDGGEGRTEYELADFWAKCVNLVVTKLGQTGLGAAMEDAECLKTEKLGEEVRKLRIQNDEAEGLLIRTSDVEHAWGRKARAMCDELDAMVSRVKVARPDVPQDVLAVIADCLATARNKAADSQTEE